MNNIKINGWNRYRYHFINQLLFAYFVLSCLFANSQNTVSPYSIFGLGEIQNKGFSRIQSMGGAGIAFRPGNSLNNVNPASYSGLDSMRIITEFGLQGKLYTLSSSNENQTGYTGNLNYVAMGFRYNRWMGGSFGIIPFSSVGYSIDKENTVEGTNAKYTSQYTGSGGITQLYYSNAFKIGKHLSMGVTVSYLFGPLIQDEIILENEEVPSFSISRRDFLKSFYFDYGLQYAFKVKKTDVVLGAVFSNTQNLKSKHILELYDGDASLIQGEIYNTDYLIVPAVFGAGIGISNNKRYQLLFDYHFQNWSDVNYPNQYNDFENVNRFSFGAGFQPWEFRPANTFYKNWTYRIGANYQNSYLSFGGIKMHDKSISFGVGVPFARKISDFDLGIKIGSNGTTKNQLIRENYVLLQLGFSLNENAFIKRSFD